MWLAGGEHRGTAAPSAREPRARRGCGETWGRLSASIADEGVQPSEGTGRPKHAVQCTLDLSSGIHSGSTRLDGLLDEARRAHELAPVVDTEKLADFTSNEVFGRVTHFVVPRLDPSTRKGLKVRGRGRYSLSLSGATTRGGRRQCPRGQRRCPAPQARRSRRRHGPRRTRLKRWLRGRGAARNRRRRHLWEAARASGRGSASGTRQAWLRANARRAWRLRRSWRRSCPGNSWLSRLYRSRQLGSWRAAGPRAARLRHGNPDNEDACPRENESRRACHGSPSPWLDE